MTAWPLMLVKGFCWLLLAVCLLLLLMLVMPVWVMVQLNYDKLQVRVKILGISWRVYPPRAKRYTPKHLRQQRKKKWPSLPLPQKDEQLAEGEEDEAVSEKPLEGKQKKHRKQTQKPDLTKVLELIAAAGKIMKLVLRTIHVKDVCLVLPIAGEDAATTGILYGEIQAAMGTVLSNLQNLIHLKLKKIDLIADFTGEYKFRRAFSCKIGATPLVLLVIILYVLVQQRSAKTQIREDFS